MFKRTGLSKCLAESMSGAIKGDEMVKCDKTTDGHIGVTVEIVFYMLIPQGVLYGGSSIHIKEATACSKSCRLATLWNRTVNAVIFTLCQVPHSVVSN